MTSSPSVSLEQFLVAQKQLWQNAIEELKNANASINAKKYNVTIVLGNEASDLDSMCCALLWSYYLGYIQKTQHTVNQITDSNSNNGNEDHISIVLPLFCIPSNELKLRKDAVFVLNEYSNTLISHCIFIDDPLFEQTMALLSMPAVNGNENDDNNNNGLSLDLHLVDHNALAIGLRSSLSPFVTCIIDHHSDQGLYTDTVQNSHRILNKRGSNITLVLETILTAIETLSESEFETICALLSTEFGLFIRSVILLDTANFNPNLNKTTPKDIEIFDKFKETNTQQNEQNEQNEFYQKLLQLRFDNSGFAFADLLVKDFKIFESKQNVSVINDDNNNNNNNNSYEEHQKENGVLFGIPGFGMALQTMLDTESDQLFADIAQLNVDKHLNVTALMSIFTNAETSTTDRQLGIFTGDQMLFNHLSSALSGVEYATILQPLHIGKYKHKSYVQFTTNGSSRLYYQWWKLDISQSRKQIAPIIDKILRMLPSHL